MLILLIRVRVRLIKESENKEPQPTHMQERRESVQIRSAREPETSPATTLARTDIRITGVNRDMESVSHKSGSSLRRMKETGT